MSFATKYKMNWLSALGYEYEIHLQKDGYSGDVLTRRISSQTLSYPDGDTIKGSSLSFKMLAVSNDDLIELYTTQRYYWKVLLKRSNSVIWSGWIVPELYSEEYVDPPYEVNVTAADGLGYLKEIDYVSADSFDSILGIIKTCLNHAQPGLNIVFFNTLSPAGMTDTWIKNRFVNKLTWEEATVYEVLEEILLSMNAVLYTKNQKWYIERNSDHSSAIEINNSTSAISPYVITRKNVNTVSDTAVFPIGQLSMEIEAAKKSITVKAATSARPSVLRNFDCDVDSVWECTTEHQPAFIPPHIETIIIGRGPGGTATKKELWNVYILPEYADMHQTVHLTANNSSYFKIEIKYLLVGQRSYSSTWAEGARLNIVISTIVSGTRLYLNLNNKSWEENPSIDDHCVQLSQPSGSTYITDRDNYQSVSADIGPIPYTNDYTVSIQYIDDDSSSEVEGAAIAGVMLFDSSFGNGLQETDTLNADSQNDADDVDLAFDTAYTSIDGNLKQLNFLASSQQGVADFTKWNWNGVQFDSYLQAMAEDYAQFNARKKYIISGNLSSNMMECDILHDVASNKDYQIRSIDLNLLEDECSVVLMEMLSNNAIITKGNLTGITSSSKSSRSGGGSGGGGGSTGFTDHAQLSGRDAEDSHPLAAITGLLAALAGKVSCASPLEIRFVTSYPSTLENGVLYIRFAAL